MPILVGVQIRKTKDKYYADAGHHDLSCNDKVIVETDDVQEVGIVVEPERMIEKDTGEIGKVVRKLTVEDQKRIIDNKAKAKKALLVVLDNIEARDLDMKLTFIDFTFDRSKLFIYYTADNRVDFRVLIKDLGHILKTRIQMVQIGVRDEAKMIGGLGPCGQVLCCNRFLRDFTPVSMEMAKEQDIALNVAKISGVCGRLMCCVSFEYNHYSETKKELPKVKSKVKTPEGEGTVIMVNCISKEITVDLGEGKVSKFPCCKVREKK
ncbi:MAG: regulatory iron-sulfur-containing complex subunit RicT [bacterium]